MCNTAKKKHWKRADIGGTWLLNVQMMISLGENSYNQVKKLWCDQIKIKKGNIRICTLIWKKDKITVDVKTNWKDCDSTHYHGAAAALRYIGVNKKEYQKYYG